MPQIGQGILKGMGVTLQHLFGQKITRQYPEYKRELPERSRGMLTVDMDRCIACLQCMRICPDHCIYHTEEFEAQAYNRLELARQFGELPVDPTVDPKPAVGKKKKPTGKKAPKTVEKPRTGDEAA
jgi:NADH-quinone oxidoreductase subunit I